MINFFSSHSRVDSSEDINNTLPFFTYNTPHRFNDISTTPEEIFKILSGLNISKASGPDGISISSICHYVFSCSHCSLPVSSILLTSLTVDQPNTDNMSTINVPTANSTIADVDDIVFHHLCRLDADCKNDVIENMIFDVDEDLLAESRDAMLNEAVERCCQEMIARGGYTSHPNLLPIMRALMLQR